MTTHRRISDLQAYRQVLPYASEIFGIYQPLQRPRMVTPESPTHNALSVDEMVKVLAGRPVMVLEQGYLIRKLP